MKRPKTDSPHQRGGQEASRADPSCPGCFLPKHQGVKNGEEQAPIEALERENRELRPGKRRPACSMCPFATAGRLAEGHRSLGLKIDFKRCPVEEVGTMLAGSWRSRLVCRIAPGGP